jgi:hypothetical protein
MSRPSLPSTPLPGTPTLRIPSPARTPSPLPLFSGGGPYSYTGQITRKYEARFSDINKKRNTVKAVEQAWEKEAKDQGMNIEQLAKNLEEDYTWEEKTISRAEHTLPQEAVIEEEEKREPKKDKKLRIDVKPRAEKRFSALSIDEDQFVDALTSPLIDKPKDSGEFPRDGDDRG